VRVLGRYGINGVRIPTLDFASAIEILDQDREQVNGESKQRLNCYYKKNEQSNHQNP
jgi:hypothetical protein